jgi:hypothetical protein
MVVEETNSDPIVHDICMHSRDYKCRHLHAQGKLAIDASDTRDRLSTKSIREGHWLEREQGSFASRGELLLRIVPMSRAISHSSDGSSRQKAQHRGSYL